MKYLQPKTLQIMLAALSRRRFSQRGLWKICNLTKKVSLGHVNNVIKDLQRNGFIERMWRNRVYEVMGEAGFIGDDTSEIMGRANYMLVDPVGLLRYISMFRSMNDLRLFTLSLNASEERIIKELSRKGAIFCLGTAQERYTPYYRPDEVSFYSQNPERLYSFLKTARKGLMKVSCYRIDYVRSTRNTKAVLDSFFALRSGNARLTSKVQTVVDMFCDGKGVYTKPLLKGLWGVEI